MIFTISFLNICSIYTSIYNVCFKHKIHLIFIGHTDGATGTATWPSLKKKKKKETRGQTYG